MALKGGFNYFSPASQTLAYANSKYFVHKKWCSSQGATLSFTLSVFFFSFHRVEGVVSHKKPGIPRTTGAGLPMRVLCFVHRGGGVFSQLCGRPSLIDLSPSVSSLSGLFPSDSSYL